MHPSFFQDFAGKRILIAGASRGLGRAAALALAAGGARLGLGARDPAALADLAAALPGTHFHAPVDLASAPQITRWAEEAIAALGGLDGLVVTVTAGRPTSGEDDFAASLQTDLMAPLRLFSACREALARSRGAAVFCSSRTAKISVPGTVAYGAAKAALEYAVGCLAADTAREGIRVNAIAPGSCRLDGGFWDRCQSENPALWAGTRAAIPAGRLAEAEDIIPPLLFLLSDGARWITGQTLLVDGGQTLAGAPASVGSATTGAA